MDAKLDDSVRKKRLADERMGRGDDMIGGCGLSVGEMRFVARRQLIGSIAAAGLIAIVAALAALPPSARQPQIPSARNFAVVQQPVFATPPGHRVAMKGGLEVP